MLQVSKQQQPQNPKPVCWSFLSPAVCKLEAVPRLRLLEQSREQREEACRVGGCQFTQTALPSPVPGQDGTAETRDSAQGEAHRRGRCWTPEVFPVWLPFQGAPHALTPHPPALPREAARQRARSTGTQLRPPTSGAGGMPMSPAVGQSRAVWVQSRAHGSAQMGCSRGETSEEVRN